MSGKKGQKTGISKGVKCSKEYRPVLLGYSIERGSYVLYQPPCGMWSCPECAKRKSSQWAIRIREGVDWYQSREIKDWMFLTLTSNPKNKTRAQCLFVWPKAWAKFSSRLRRRYPGIRYTLLPELHKNGRVHVHAVASHGVSNSFLTKNTYVCGLGYKRDSKAIDDGFGAMFYVVKYLAKAQEVLSWPKNFRRVRTSQSWPPLEDTEDFEREAIEWTYQTTYASDGLDYYADYVQERLGIPVKII